MGISSITATNFYKAKDIEGNTENNSKKMKMTWNNADIGSVLQSGTISVDGVTIELSEEAKQALLDAREKLYKDQETEGNRWVAEFNSYVARQQREVYADAADDLSKVLTTARRIAKGDIVPAKDEQKLLEYSDELYQMAKNAAMLHKMEKRKKDKSLYEEEEERTYTDPEEETTPMQKYGVQVEVSVGDTGVVESISEGIIEQ